MNIEHDQERGPSKALDGCLQSYRKKIRRYMVPLQLAPGQRFRANVRVQRPAGHACAISDRRLRRLARRRTESRAVWRRLVFMTAKTRGGLACYVSVSEHILPWKAENVSA